MKNHNYHEPNRHICRSQMTGINLIKFRLAFISVKFPLENLLTKEMISNNNYNNNSISNNNNNSSINHNNNKIIVVKVIRVIRVIPAIMIIIML